MSLFEVILGTLLVVGHNVLQVVPNEVFCLFGLFCISFTLRDGGWRVAGLLRSLLYLTTNLTLAVTICLGASLAYADVYKCKDGAGKTAYSDIPCDTGSKPLELTDPTKGDGTDPHMCEQLLDETNRLASEADRNAKRGRAESTSSANRRKALNKQYEARCVGISRSR